MDPGANGGAVFAGLHGLVFVHLLYLDFCFFVFVTGRTATGAATMRDLALMRGRWLSLFETLPTGRIRPNADWLGNGSIVCSDLFSHIVCSVSFVCSDLFCQICCCFILFNICLICLLLYI